MKTRNILMTLVALLAFAGNAWADTTKLLEADGWTKITTLPTATDIANNYYVFVDTNNDLMLGTKKGTHQNAKTFSLGVYYFNSVEPTSKDINNMVWTLEDYQGNYAMRNLEFSVYVFQTEGSGAHMWDTNDVKTPNGWTPIKLAYADGSWTMENAHYGNNYIGPWDAKNFTDGAECAGNKTGDNIGKFQIYTISRAQFKQNLLDNASSSNPVDLTPWYVTNATFDGGNRSGWNETGNGNNNNTHATNLGGAGCEIWHRSSFSINQEVTVPNGKYQVSLQIAGTSGAGEVYGTADGNTQSAYSSAAAGKNFDETVLAMSQDPTYGRTTTGEITVSNGSLTMGMRCATTDQWLVFDNFKLYCTGLDLSAYQSQLANLVQECNDFISSNVVPDACETIVSNAVTQYNKTYETAKEYSAAIVALTNVLNTYRNDTDLQTAYANFKTFKTNIETLTTEQESSTELTTFNNAVNTATANVEAATTAAAITAQIANLRSAGLTYISSVEGQFDITFLASQNFSDWKKKDGSAADLVAEKFLKSRPSTIPPFAESDEKTCATTGNVLYQTVESLPAGYYQVSMYAAAMYTSGRGFDTEAAEGDADRTFAFAGDLNDQSSVLRTGAPISFLSERNFSDLTILDVNVHLTGSGNANNLTFGITKDANGSNWHFAQIASIVYSSQPDLTNLQATRDELVATAQGLLASSGQYLSEAQKTALNTAITEGNNANDFESLNTATLTLLPDAINTAKQQIAQAKAAIPVLRQALQRFEKDYNLTDGTDYSRQTMSAKAWTDLLAKVDAATVALDDISQAGQYTTIANELNAQMDATDASIRLFKNYKVMVEGTQSLNITEGTTYAADSHMDSDATEQAAITALNTAFVTYCEGQSTDVNMAGFLGENLDFSAAAGANLNNTSNNNINEVAGWEVAYADADQWAVIQTDQKDNTEKLYMRKNWASGQTTLTVAKQRMLPDGVYRLSFKWNSTMQNMTNLSKYTLGDASTALGQATSGEETLTYDFTVSGGATEFGLMFGFKRTGTGEAPAQIIVDDVQLICLAGTPFQRAYNDAKAVAGETAETAAAKSAVEEYQAYDNNESELLEDGARGDKYWEAVYVLKNAKTIAEANGDATSLVVNADLSNTTLNDDAPYGWRRGYTNVNGGSDVATREQEGRMVFNYWRGTVNTIEFLQDVANLPQGTYRLSIDLGTNNIPEGNAPTLINFIIGKDNVVAASQQCITLNENGNRGFGTYTSANDVGDTHSLRLGVRSDGQYLQMTNIHLTYLGDAAQAAEEKASALLRQDYLWNRAAESREFDFTADKYAAAKGVTLYPQGQNQIIHALAGQLTNTENVDAGGTCANFVINDGKALVNTKAFTATNATYTRAMSASTIWGTLLLPYPLTSDESVQYYAFKQISVDSEGLEYMGFAAVPSVDANTPVVFKKLADSAESLTFEGTGNVAQTTAEQGSATVDNDSWTMAGVYASTTLTEEQIDGTVYYIAQNQFWKANTEVGLTIPAFRAYFHGPSGESAAKFRIKILDGDETGIEELENLLNGRPTGDVYDLSGRKVSNPGKGMYIIGGKKVLFK